MITGILHTHTLLVILFLLLYLVKLGLLLFNQNEVLEKVAKATRIPEMVVSALFLLTGIALMAMAPMRIDILLIIKIVAVLASIPLAIIGFRKSNKMLATLSVVLIVAAYGMAEAHAGRMGESQEPLPAEVVTLPSADGYDQMAHGKALYERNCIVCHGEDGALKFNAAANLQESALNGPGVMAAVQNGIGKKMPAYSFYSKEELEAVSTYVLSLKQ